VGSGLGLKPVFSESSIARITQGQVLKGLISVAQPFSARTCVLLIDLLERKKTLEAGQSLRMNPVCVGYALAPDLSSLNTGSVCGRMAAMLGFSSGIRGLSFAC
jgi:hypothetical protein